MWTCVYYYTYNRCVRFAPDLTVRKIKHCPYSIKYRLRRVGKPIPSDCVRKVVSARSCRSVGVFECVCVCTQTFLREYDCYRRLLNPRRIRLPLRLLSSTISQSAILHVAPAFAIRHYPSHPDPEEIVCFPVRSKTDDSNMHHTCVLIRNHAFLHEHCVCV